MTMIVRSTPGSYPQTWQQRAIAAASVRCGVHKGMTRGELVEQMTNCVPAVYQEEAVRKKSIQLFVGGACKPCGEMKEMVTNGRFESNVPGDVGLDLIDVTEEDGFPFIEKENLEQVPTAKYDGEVCKLEIDREDPGAPILIITCPGGEEGSEQQVVVDMGTPAPG